MLDAIFISNIETVHNAYIIFIMLCLIYVCFTVQMFWNCIIGAFFTKTT